MLDISLLAVAFHCHIRLFPQRNFLLDKDLTYLPQEIQTQR